MAALRTLLFVCVAATWLAITGLVASAFAQAPAWRFTDCAPVRALPDVSRGDLGWHGNVWCVMPDSTTKHYTLDCLHGTCSWSTFQTELQALMTAPDKSAKWDEIVAKYFSWVCDDAIRKEASQRGALCLEGEAIRLQHPEWLPKVTLPPPVITYRVKVNGTSATRPAYALVAGVRGTKVLARAVVGTACDLTKPTLASGADVWAEFGTPGVVALCAKS